MVGFVVDGSIWNSTFIVALFILFALQAFVAVRCMCSFLATVFYSYLLDQFFLTVCHRSRSVFRSPSFRVSSYMFIISVCRLHSLYFCMLLSEWIRLSWLLWLSCTRRCFLGETSGPLIYRERESRRIQKTAAEQKKEAFYDYYLFVAECVIMELVFGLSARGLELQTQTLRHQCPIGSASAVSVVSNQGFHVIVCKYLCSLVGCVLL